MEKLTKNFSRKDAEILLPQPYTCLISITNPPGKVSPHNRTIGIAPNHANLICGWMDVLRIQFWDVEEDSEEYSAMTEDQAKEIAAFIRRNKDLNIFAHCEQGVSRSAAIVSVLLGLGWKPFLQPNVTRANSHVCAMLLNQLTPL